MSLLEQQAVLEAPRLGVRTWAHDVYVVFWREMRRFVGQRMRILALVAQPIIWLVFMGNMLQGLTAEFAASALLGTDSYVAFMLPGIVVMTALFAGLFSGMRSEEHTSELQSRENLVCRLLLEKKNTAT